jgi:excisionase family DNA binding protein
VADNEFFSFEEALDELRLKDEELKRLVSEGEIRAFREGDTMKLRRSDVDSLRSDLSGEVVSVGGASEEVVFEEAVDLEDEAGMATQEIADVDTLIEEDVEDVGEIDLVEEEDVAAGAPVRRSAPARRSAVGSASTADGESSEGMGLRIAAIATTLVLILGLPIALALSRGQVNSVAEGIAGIFGAKF